MEKPRRRSVTSPGLGDSGLRARPVMPTVPPQSGMRASTEESRPPATEKISRPPVRIDDFGDAAVAIASRAARPPAPRLLKSREQLTSAPIDHREAFVLSLVDGKMGFAAIVDAAAIPREKVRAILDRLVQLGIITLP